MGNKQSFAGLENDKPRLIYELVKRVEDFGKVVPDTINEHKELDTVRIERVDSVVETRWLFLLHCFSKMWYVHRTKCIA
jgi:hypothetical protein